MVQDLELKDYILLSLRAHWAEEILAENKMIEVRRRPMNLREGTTAVLYAGPPHSGVLGVCRIDAIHRGAPSDLWQVFGERTGLSRRDYDAYLQGAEATCLVLSGPRKVEKPVPLGFRPPQSWMRLSSALPEHRALMQGIREAI